MVDFVRDAMVNYFTHGDYKRWYLCDLSRDLLSFLRSKKKLIERDGRVHSEDVYARRRWEHSVASNLWRFIKDDDGTTAPGVETTLYHLTQNSSIRGDGLSVAHNLDMSMVDDVISRTNAEERLAMQELVKLLRANES